MATYRVNKRGVAKARELIDAGQYRVRSRWADVQPRAAAQNAFLKAHPDLYGRTAGAVRLRILEGRIAIGSLACPGYAVAAEPDWSSMRPGRR